MLVYDEILRIIDEVMAKPPNHFKKKSQEFLRGKIDVVDFIIKELFDLARRRYSL